MDKVWITMMLEPTPVKPERDEDKEAWAIALGRSPHADLTVEELAEFVGNRSYSWCHGIFRKGMGTVPCSKRTKQFTDFEIYQY